MTYLPIGVCQVSVSVITGYVQNFDLRWLNGVPFDANAFSSLNVISTVGLRIGVGSSFQQFSCYDTTNLFYYGALCKIPSKSF